ncbi:MAG: hypothetical protein KDK59_09490 [Simkania sp.]|nr:hypothetical protein [Simkania sp.]
MATLTHITNNEKVAINQPTKQSSDQKKLDSLFIEQIPGESYLTDKPIEREIESLTISEIDDSTPQATHQVAQSYFHSLGTEIRTVDRMFDGKSVKARVDGSQRFMQIRKDAGREMFIQAARPKIEALLLKHGEKRPFDEVVSIFGFNRLFMRELGSAGTDVDFFMLVDTKNDSLMSDIHTLMKTEIAPALAHMGIDMETASYLMIRMDQYLGKLSETHKTLFTLANTDNVDFITGSKELINRAFTLTNDQLATHFVALLEKNEHIPSSEAIGIKKQVLDKLNGSPDARREIISLLRKMASSELYIGKTPYKGKKTIQTELKKVSPESRSLRKAEVSIKFNFNRIADMYMTTSVDPRREILSGHQIQALEKLSMALSNIKCRIDDEKTHPLLKVQQNYSSVSLEDLRKFSMSDRQVVAELLTAFSIQIDPHSESFAEDSYDALWALSDQMGKVAVALEGTIYEQAIGFIPKPEVKSNQSQSPSYLTIGLASIAAIAVLGLGYAFLKKNS